MVTIIKFFVGKDNKLLDTHTYFCVSILHVDISCNKLFISVDFGMFAYLVFIIVDVSNT